MIRMVILAINYSSIPTNAFVQALWKDLHLPELVPPDPALAMPVASTVFSGHRQANLADIIFAMSVNFLLYVLLIIVFYMLVRFYLEEETSSVKGYQLVSMEDDDAVTNNKTLIGDQTQTPNSTATPAPPLSSSNKSKSSSFLNLNEFNEPEGTKQEVIQRLIFCAAGLIVSFSIWGLVQERILTQTYGGDFFVYSYGLVFMNRLGGLLFSAYLMHHFNITWEPAALWEYSFPSVANMLSSWSQYEALAYVSFPIVMLAKACKMIPIMLMVSHISYSYLYSYFIFIFNIHVYYRASL
jgi:hypothetical protein